MHRMVTSGPGIPPAAGPYSPGFVSGDLCFLSGQIGLDPETGNLVAGTIASEAAQAVRNLLAVVAAAGFRPTDLALVLLLLTDVTDFGVVNEAYANALPESHRPARMTFAAAALPLGARVEVQGFAVRSGTA